MLVKVGRKGVVIHDPKAGVVTCTFEEVEKHWTGPALEILPSLQFQPVNDRPKMSLSAPSWVEPTGLQRALIQAAILALTLEVFTVINPMMMQLVVDDALVTMDKDLLYVVGGAIIFIGLMKMMTTALRQRVMLHLGADMSLQWIANVVAHMLRLVTSYFDRRGLADTMSRVASVSQIQQTLTTSFISALLDGVMSVVMLVVMFVYSAKLASVAVVAVLLYAGARWLRYERLRVASQGQVQRQARVQTKLIELIRNVRLIKLFNAQDAFKLAPHRRCPSTWPTQV